MVDPFSAIFGDGRGSGQFEPVDIAGSAVQPNGGAELDEDLAVFVRRLPVLTPIEASRIGREHAAAVEGNRAQVEAAWVLARDIAAKVPRISARWDAGWDAAVLATPLLLWPEVEAAVRDAVMSLAMRNILSNDQFELLFGAWRHP